MLLKLEYWNLKFPSDRNLGLKTRFFAIESKMSRCEGGLARAVDLTGVTSDQ